MQKDHWESNLVVVHDDVLQAAGSLQLCAGQPTGCETAVHAVGSIFSDANTEGILLADASIVINCLNRWLALANGT